MTISDIMNIPLQFKVRGTMRNLHPTPMPLWSMLKGMAENAALAKLTAFGRALSDKEEFKAWKPKSLMSVYLAVRFKNIEGKPDTANIGGYTGLAGFDFDDVEAAAVLEKLHEVPQVVCAGVSASGKGVWCAAHVACGTAQEYAAAFARGIETFTAAGFAGMDIGAHDPTRARFVASSPECWWRWDADGDIPAFSPDGNIMVLGNPKKEGRGEVKMPVGYSLTPETAFDEVRRILSTADTVADGDRNAEKARQCGQLKSLAKRAGVQPAAYFQAFVNKWDSVGSTHKKTVSIANRLLLGGKKGRTQ